MKILQINLGRRRMAHDMAHLVATEKEMDLIVACEPNKKLAEGVGWLTDVNGDVAIYFRNRNLEIRSYERKEGYMKVSFKEWDLYNCYLSPNIDLNRYKEKTDKILEELRSTGREAIVVGDINAKSPRWGNSVEDERGKYWIEWLEQLDLVVENRGSTPTFERNGARSCLDITLATNSLSRKIEDWRVMEEVSHSDHNYIFFEVKAEEITNKSPTVWLCNKEAFKAELRERIKDKDIQNMTWEEGVKEITESYKRTRSSYAVQTRKKPYWWNDEIEEFIKKTQKIRRRCSRIRGRGDSEISGEIRELEELYKAKKKEVQKIISKEKRKKWEELLAETEDDIWGEGYRIVTKRFGNCWTPFRMTEDKEEEVIRKLFPLTQKRTITTTDRGVLTHFTREELEEAKKRIRKGKAPGPDRIPPEIIIAAIEEAPQVILRIMNTLLEKEEFPKKWKRAKVALIPKGREETKNSDQMKYRPICLIDCIGKLMERLLSNRLVKEMEERGSPSERQFGFRKNSSCIKALQTVIEKAKSTEYRWCTLIAVDVKNAFNSAPWYVVMKELRKLEIPGYLIHMIGEYLTDRKILTSRGKEMEITAGVPQGSILGPILWNVLYDGVLRLRTKPGVYLIAYADDLALIVEANTVEELNGKANKTLKAIGRWMEANGLELAPEKTELVIMKGPRKREEVDIRMSGKRITQGKCMKYLGVLIDDKLTFGQHVIQVCVKAEKLITALGKLMPRVKGPREYKRRLYVNVAESIISYGAPVWAGVIRIEKYKKKLESNQRRMLIRAISAYKTIAAEGAQVIAGKVPIDLLLDERKRIYNNIGEDKNRIKREEREVTIRKWQERWDNQTAQKARWTRRIIKNLTTWINCKHRSVDYYITQVLSGHGSFREYTQRIKKTPDSRCIYCGEHDDVKHTIFKCRRWDTQRITAYIEVGDELNEDNMVDIMMEDKKNWAKIGNFIRKVMKKKEEEERLWNNL